MNNQTVESWSSIHPVSAADKAAMAALRVLVEPNKGKLRGTAGREPFDGVMNQVAAPAGVTFQSDTIGGLSGYWCRPASVRSAGVILHLHGGWFNWGTAKAYRNFVGHIADRAGAAAFIPDYRLAPEHPFPAGVQDVQACYAALVERGTRRIALTGDSAGGGLALVLLSLATTKESDSVSPVGAVALSPVTDLAMTGASWKTRAVADPYFTEPQAFELVQAYLGNAAPTDPLASPLYGNLAGLPPVRIHVGDDEVLLDDSVRYVQRAVDAGVDAKLDVREGMPHGYWSGVGMFAAAAQTLDAVGTFLAERLSNTAI